MIPDEYMYFNPIKSPTFDEHIFDSLTLVFSTSCLIIVVLFKRNVNNVYIVLQIANWILVTML